MTARALAGHLGLSNSTFWRCFPAIAQTVADERRQSLRNTPPAQLSPEANARQTEARLRAENRVLRGQLDLAIATIQRMSLELDDFRTQSQQLAGIARIRPEIGD
ncbi:hypothetical protein [Microbacterium sp. CFBP9034]|uniref:hypothetical protein n=1 Tax=Microbacterium sp. CFBP9034 TaxID=3096540 RepID=UPI002A69A29C|nr:hypothetical protein [Microbacterium sp. CFBP9034]MDY0909512.1 hypothetical protein [Microbacterium sp. CFBP9034]